MYGHPLGLAYRLLDVVFLPLGSIGGKDCELMQLKTVQECTIAPWALSLVLLDVYTSPQVTIMHLVHNTVPLGLRITS